LILRETRHRAVIIGAGQGGVAMIELLLGEEMVTIAAVADTNPEAPGMSLARRHGIPTYGSVEEALRDNAPCVAFNLTHDNAVEQLAVEILGAGSVVGGLEANLVWRMVTNLQMAKEELRYHAMHDALTGLYNRRYMGDQLRQGIAQALRYGFVFSVVLLDVDHFKQVNDTYGHAVGDSVLQGVAQSLQQGLRSADTLGRWGGEEFIIALPHTGHEGARQVAEHCLQRVSAQPMPMGQAGLRVMTLSAGVATFDPQILQEVPAEQVVDRLLALADTRLYAAKAAGRARVEGEQSVESASF